MRLIIHIGDRKTGSTALQGALDIWDRARRAEGIAPGEPILYPQSGRMGGGPGASRMNHTNLAHLLWAPGRVRADAGGWPELGAELAEAAARGSDLALISSEGFESVAPEQLAEAAAAHLPGVDLSVLCYVRPHMSRIASSWAQNVKSGKETRSLDAFARRAASGRLGQFMPRLSAWREMFGDRFVLRPFDRDLLLGGDILNDVLEGVAGLEPGFVEALPDVTGINASPSLVVLEIVRALMADAPALSPAGVGKAGRMALSDLVDALEALHPGAPAPWPDPELAEAIREACTRDARRVDAAFMDGPVLERALDAGVARAGRTLPEADTERDRALHDAYRAFLSRHPATRR